MRATWWLDRLLNEPNGSFAARYTLVHHSLALAQPRSVSTTHQPFQLLLPSSSWTKPHYHSDQIRDASH